MVGGDCTVKKLERRGEDWWLVPANPAYQPYHIQNGEDIRIWGVVTHVVRELLPRAHFACLYAKPEGRPLADTFVTEVPQDTWVLFPWDTAPQFVPPLAKG